MLLALKLRFGANLLMFEVSLLVDISNAKQLLLLPEHRGEKCKEWSGSLGGGDYDDVGGVAGGDYADAVGDGISDIRLSIKYCKGLR